MQPAPFENNSFVPNPSNCGNKWCNAKGNIPTSGQFPQLAQCGDLGTMLYERDTTGGISGRGVTPCPYGYLQKFPWKNNKTVLVPYSGNFFDKFSPSSIFFDPDRPGYLPPQGEPRSLVRVGYEWRQ